MPTVIWVESKEGFLEEVAPTVWSNLPGKPTPCL